MFEPNCAECSLDGVIVPGSGNRRNPTVVFVGEAPGQNEVEQGKPFVGMAGQVIRGVLQYVGFSDDQIYFTNICSCRPPKNRNPTAAEIQCCWPRLNYELSVLNPQFVVALGAVAGKALFGRHTTMDSHRGRFLETVTGHQGMLTYHPAAMLYPKGERLFDFVLSDLQRLYRKVGGSPLPLELTQPDTHVVIIDTPELVADLVKKLTKLQEPVIAFDWETTGTSPLRDVGYCLGLSWKPGTAVVIPANILRQFYDMIQPALKHVPCSLAGYNAILFDAKFSEKLGLNSQVTYDGQLIHYLLDERPQRRSLENLSVQLLDAPPYESEMLARYGCTKATMLEKIPPEVIYTYCGRDADWSLRLVRHLYQELSKTESLTKLYHQLIVPGARAFADIQQHGVWVAQDKLAARTAEYEARIDELMMDLSRLTNDEAFNPRSHPQVQKFLWDALGLDEPDLYNRKPRSADKETLIALQEAYPQAGFVSTLMEYRTVYTLYSRYLRGLPDFLDPDGRVRTSYHFDRTETGRLSTTDPPLHQIPRESDIRSIFGAPPGFALLQGDYQQIEVRMAAHIAKDAKLTELLQSGVDFHSLMASQAFQVPLDQVTPDLRQAAKAVSFGLLYLMSNKKLADSTGLPAKDAADFVRSYKELMPDVQRWIEMIKSQVRSQRYIESPFGRRRRFPLITRSNLSALQREAVNFPVQSGASDLTLSSVIELHGLFKRFYPEVRIVIMVHDSIVVECPIPLMWEVGPLMLRVMQTTPFETDVPFPVELKVGQYWGEGSKVTP